MTRSIFGMAVAVMLLATAPAGAADTVQLKFGNWAPPQDFMARNVLGPWIEDVNKAAEGTLDLKWLRGGALGNPLTMHDNLRNGIADIAWILPELARGKFTRLSVANVPFLMEGVSSEQASVALWRLFEKGTIAGDFDEVQPLGLSIIPAFDLHSREPITGLEGLRGKKIRIQTAVANNLVRAFGGAGVPVPPSDLYQALQLGTVDGAMASPIAIRVFKIDEVTHHHLIVPMSSAVVMVAANKESLAKLPAKAREALVGRSGEQLSRALGKASDAESIGAWKHLRSSKDHTVSEASAEDLARWKKVAEPVVADWIKSGPENAAILAALRAEMAAAGK